MKLFIDANVLVAVLNREYPLFTYAARVLSLADQSKYQLLTSPTCIAIAFYFASKKSGEAKAKEKIETLLNHIGLTTVDEACTKKAVTGPRVLDLENGMQYYSALAASCEVIITENGLDFHFSEMATSNCRDFLFSL